MANRRHTRELADVELRVKALEQVLTEKGLVDTAALDAVIEAYENDVGPHVGAKVVARAWMEPQFRARLLEDGADACQEVPPAGIEGAELQVVENTTQAHNVVVCTLCSCYPWPLLGLPPTWYKSFAYRARLVREPRAVLSEFGLEIAADRQVRVWDSSSEVRYLVLPQRPPGTEALDEAALAGLVTRDGMIGTALV